MIGRRIGRRRPSGGFVARALVLASAAASAWVVTGPAALPAVASTAPTVRAPLNGSVTSGADTWATVPMGHLDQLANRFWQLFSLAPGGTRWRLVTPPGVADNGGLVTATDGGPTTVTGFEPSQDLLFSPLAETVDGGTTWHPGLLDHGLEAVPDALAVSTSGHLLALGRGGSVSASSGALSSWRPLTQAREIGRSAAGRACGVVGIGAVAFGPTADPLVGTSCAHPGRVGLFQLDQGQWRSDAPAPPAALRHGRISVLRLTSTPGDGVTALYATRGAGLLRLVRAYLPDGDDRWHVSSTLTLPASAPLRAVSVAGGGRAVVLLGRSPEEVSTGGSWTMLPAAPPATGAVVAAAAGGTAAFSVAGSWLTVYTLDQSGRGWARTQATRVPIQYGSSG